MAHRLWMGSMILDDKLHARAKRVVDGVCLHRSPKGLLGTRSHAAHGTKGETD